MSQFLSNIRFQCTKSLARLPHQVSARFNYLLGEDRFGHQQRALFHWSEGPAPLGPKLARLQLGELTH